MPRTWIRNINEISGGLRTDSADGPFTLNVGALKRAQSIRAEISTDGRFITSSAGFDLSDALVEALRTTAPEDSIGTELESELLAALSILSATSRSILRLIQQETEDHSLLPHNQLLGFRGGFQWSSDGSQWNPLPVHGGSITFSMHKLGTLDNSLLRTIQNLLDNSERPLLAYVHLFHAERSDGLRFKWIEATIAAELAVKEVLMNVAPTIRPLLEELPSPPLRKLYGTILEQYTGERSPFVRKLNEGAERRNRLVHRPEVVRLDHQEVLDYVQVVREAIRHLVDLQRKLIHKPIDDDGGD